MAPPGRQGFFFPPEWYPHRATWLSWPHNKDTWPGHLPTIYESYLQFIEVISRGEIVCINVADPLMQREAEQKLLSRQVDLSTINFYHHPTNDAWCRDHGPCFLINPHYGKLIVDWEYNAWGGKYPPFDLDNAIPAKIASKLNLPLVQPGIVMEGGSVDFNGNGTLLTTTSCLLNPNRNPQLSQVEIEKLLGDFYGVRQVLWLNDGIAGDDTDGHVDDTTRFVNETTVVTVVEEDPTDPNFEPLQENLKLLHQMKLWDGRHLNVVTLPMPGPVFGDGQRLPASYANFYVCNSAVIVPTFNDPMDSRALDTLSSLFTDRQVMGIDSRNIIGGLGSFHCLSQQEPIG